MYDATTAHYSHALATEKILQRIREHYPSGPTLFQLAPIDQLHTGGIKASEQLLKHLSSEHRVLDIGSGLGGLMRLIADRAGSQVIGLDITHPFNLLNQQLSQLWNTTTNTRLTTANGEQLPFTTACFDRVLFQHSLVNIPDKCTALQEARRVLKPQGQIVLHELLQGPAHPQLNYPVPWASNAKHSHLLQYAQLQQLLADAGFDILHCQNLSDSARAWRTRQHSKENNGTEKKAVLSPALVLGEHFLQMGQNVMHGLEHNALQVIELTAAPRAQPSDH